MVWKPGCWVYDGGMEDSGVTAAPKPSGTCHHREVVVYWTGEGKYIPLVVPNEIGLRKATLKFPFTDRYSKPEKAGIYVLSFCWIRKYECFENRWEQGWFPPSHRRLSILELAHLEEGTWVSPIWPTA